MGGNDNVFGNELMCPIDGESGKNENILNLEDAIDIQQNTEQGTSIQNDGCYHNNQKHPKVKDFVEYKIFGSNYFQKAQIIKRAGKVSGKHSDWYNIKDINDDTISNIDWKKKTFKKLYGSFLRMEFNCLKATATLRRQFTFYHSVPRNSWYSFYQPRKDERLSQPWSHPVVLNTGLGIQRLNH